MDTAKTRAYSLQSTSAARLLASEPSRPETSLHLSATGPHAQPFQRLLCPSAGSSAAVAPCLYERHVFPEPSLAPSHDMATTDAQVAPDNHDDTGLAESMNQINLGDRDDGPPKTEAEYAQSQLTLRAIVSSKEAGVIIGKAGKNVADLRDETGVKAGVSKVVPGVHDRVLTVTGELQGISKAYAIVAKGLLEGAPQMGMGGVISNNGTHRKSSLRLAETRLFLGF